MEVIYFLVIYFFLIVLYLFLFQIVIKNDKSNYRTFFVLAWALSMIAIVVYPFFLEGFFKLLAILSVVLIIVSFFVECIHYNDNNCPKKDE